MKRLSFWPVTPAIALGVMLAFLSAPAFSQEEEGVTLRGDSLQTLESRSTQDFPGLSTEGARVNPRLSTPGRSQGFPNLRLNENVDVMYQESTGSGEGLGLFRSPGDVRPSGTVNLRLQLEE